MSNVLESKSSSATLVDNLSPPKNSSTSHSITSTTSSASEHPLTAHPLPPHIETDGDIPVPTPVSFDPNAAKPPNAVSPTLRDPPLTHSPHLRDSTVSTLSLQQAQDQWNHIVSSSLTALASQFDAASRQLTTEPLAAPFLSASDTSTALPLLSRRNGGVSLPVDTSILARLDTIESTQTRLRDDLEEVRLRLKGLSVDSGDGDLKVLSTWKSKEKEKEIFVEERLENADMNVRVDNLQSRTEGLESRMEALEKTIEGIVESIKLDQARLYSRLHNAAVALNKQAIKAPPMANGKSPQNFPATKGEFEHLTRERYENILKSYNLSVKGDIKAKREAVREFIGLTPPGK